MTSRAMEKARAIAVTLVSLAMVVSAHAGPWKGQVVAKDGVRHVVNPAQGMEPPATVRLQELWRIGGESDEKDELFGLVRQVATDRDGNVYLLDYLLCEIKVFSSEGKFMRTIGREGEGPGEFRRPDSICMSPTGLVCVSAAYPSRIVRFTTTGEHAGTILIPEDGSGASPIIFDAANGGDRLVIRASNQFFDEDKEVQSFFICTIDDQGNERVRYCEETRSTEFAKPVVDEEGSATLDRWAVGPDGKVHVASSFADYEISVWRPNGELDRVTERAYDHRKRSEKEKQFVHDQLSAYRTGMPPETEFKVEDCDKDIMALYTRADGTTWVLTSRGFYDRPRGSIGVFDVFDDDGRLVQQVTLMGTGDPFEDRYYFLGDRLYVVRHFMGAVAVFQARASRQDDGGGSLDAEPMSVICYGIER